MTFLYLLPLVDNLKDYSIITLDNDLRINSWNSEAASIFGYEPDEIIGENHIAEMLMKRYIGVLPALEYPKESEKILNRLTICK